MQRLILFVVVCVFGFSFQVASAAVETVRIYPTDDGVNLLYDDEQQTDWSLARHYSGPLVQITNTDAETITLRSDNHSGFYRIYRGSIAFNTESIPENAIIQSATIYLYKYPFSNNHADTDIVLTSHSRVNESILTQSDWYLPNYGTEFARGLLSDVQYTPYALNQNGLAYINTSGMSIFGAMTEFDFDDVNPHVAPADAAMYSSDAIGLNNDPYLEVIYTIPDTEQTVDELISELKLVINNEITRKAHNSVYLAQVHILEHLIEKNKIGAALVHIKVLEKQIKHDQKSGVVSSGTAEKMGNILELIKEALQ